MKKILFLVLASCFIAACNDSNPVGDPIEIINDIYDLPEQGASQWANDYIVNLYEESGSYITYHPTQADFVWTYGPAPTYAPRDTIMAGDPQYVEPLLRLLDSIWISGLTPEGKRGNSLPYRILLADKMWTYNERTGLYVNIPAKVTGRSIAFSGVNAEFGQMTQQQKDALIVSFNAVIRTDYYEATGLTPFPEEFYTVTDWAALKTASGGFPNDEDKLQAGVMPARTWAVVRPGIPPTYGWRYASWWTPYVGGDPWTPAGPEQWNPMDKDNYLKLLFQAPDSEIQPYLDAYPKIKEKWDMLLDMYESINFDPRTLANATVLNP